MYKILIRIQIEIQFSTLYDFTCPWAMDTWNSINNTLLPIKTKFSLNKLLNKLNKNDMTNKFDCFING